MMRLAARLLTRYSQLSWALADQTMVSGVNFLTGILLARYLGLEEFGRFTLAWMAVLFVNSIQNAAIISPMMGIGPKQPEAQAPAYYGAVVVQQIVLSGLVFLLLLAGVRLSGVVFPEWRVEGLALPLAVAAVAVQFQDFLRRYFFTRGRGAAAFANDAIRYLGQIAVLVWLFLSFQDAMDSAKVVWVIALIAAAAAACAAFYVERVEINGAIIRTTTFRHYRFSKWLIASAVMHWSTGNLFILAAGTLLGASAVGSLRAAQNLMGVTHILFMGLENIVPARAAWHVRHGRGKALVAYLRRVTMFGGVAVGGIALAAAAVPEFWLDLAYGNEFAGYGYLLRWYAVIYLLMYLRIPLGAGMRAIEFTRPIFNANLAGAVLTVATMYPLIHWLGLNGAMVGILLVTVGHTAILITYFGDRLRVLAATERP